MKGKKLRVALAVFAALILIGACRGEFNEILTNGALF